MPSDALPLPPAASPVAASANGSGLDGCAAGRRWLIRRRRARRGQLGRFHPLRHLLYNLERASRNASSDSGVLRSSIANGTESVTPSGYPSNAPFESTAFSGSSALSSTRTVATAWHQACRVERCSRRRQAAAAAARGRATSRVGDVPVDRDIEAAEAVAMTIPAPRSRRCSAGVAPGRLHDGMEERLQPHVIQTVLDGQVDVVKLALRLALVGLAARAGEYALALDAREMVSTRSVVGNASSRPDACQPSTLRKRTPLWLRVGRRTRSSGICQMTSLT